MNRLDVNLEQGRVFSKTLIIILAVIGVAIIGWAIFAQNGTKEVKPRDAADNFVKLLSEKNIDSSYEQLSTTFRESTPKEDWKAWVDFTFSDSKEITFLEEIIVQDAAATYGDTANPKRYIYSFTFGGTTYDLSLVTINDNGTWKISETGVGERL